MSKYRTWKDIKKEIESDLSEEDLEEIELEKQIIRTIIEARKNANLTQQELGKKSGIIQPSIAKIENYERIPQYTTLMRLLRPMGYTLKVVPLKEETKKNKR